MITLYIKFLHVIRHLSVIWYQINLMQINLNLKATERYHSVLFLLSLLVLNKHNKTSTLPTTWAIENVALYMEQ